LVRKKFVTAFEFSVHAKGFEGRRVERQGQLHERILKLHGGAASAQRIRVRIDEATREYEAFLDRIAIPETEPSEDQRAGAAEREALIDQYEDGFRAVSAAMEAITDAVRGPGSRSASRRT